jgi:hypothetical protein
MSSTLVGLVVRSIFVRGEVLGTSLVFSSFVALPASSNPKHSRRRSSVLSWTTTIHGPSLLDDTSLVPPPGENTERGPSSVVQYKDMLVPQRAFLLTASSMRRWSNHNQRFRSLRPNATSRSLFQDPERRRRSFPVRNVRRHLSERKTSRTQGITMGTASFQLMDISDESR